MSEVRRLDLEEVKRLYTEEMWSLPQIMAKFQSSYKTVRRHLLQAGVQIQPGGGRRGKFSGHWKGGRSVSKLGYVLILDHNHPKATKRGYVFEHIKVWEEHNKKSVPEGWVIHHINGVKTDNRPSNLLSMPKKGHYTKQLMLDIQKKVRELEIENRQLRRALEDSQMIFYMNEN